jgi:hypothetical protein
MRRKTISILFVIIVTLISIQSNLLAANTLPIGQDEPYYLSVALRYNNDLRNGQVNQIWWDDINYEHPILYKVIYGLSLFTQDPIAKINPKDVRIGAPMNAETSGKPWLLAGRITSAVINNFTVMVLTILNPLAGLFLGIDTININYNSRFTLEALPLFSSLLCACLYLLWEKTPKTQHKRRGLFFFLSTFFLGITAASKYIYCLVGLVIITDYIIDNIHEKRVVRDTLFLLFWGGMASLTFFIFDPILWPHPYQRLFNSITFHQAYATSHSDCCSYPFYQGIIWLTKPYTAFFPDLKASFRVFPDTIIFILGVIGLPWLFHKKRFWAIWFIEGGIFLLLWSVKWPQYSLILLIPLCMSAGEIVTEVIHLMVRYLNILVRKPRNPFYGVFRK